MTDRSLELALQIQTDMENAVQDVKQLDTAIDAVNDSSRATSKGLDTMAKAADTAADKASKAEVATNKLSASQRRLKTESDAATASLRRNGLTVGQQTQAMRQLPMQITDIVTGLASGQNPFIVAIQQGGQLRDSFGGIVPAARALVGALNPLTLTIGAATVGIGAYILALKQGQDEMAGFERALILTGNSAGTTADELDAMADRLDSSTSATAGRAAEVIAEVASTGQFTKEQIELVATAALQMEATTGRAIEETVNEFVKLGKDPVNAILALNESQHFLTEETLKQIRTFQEQGNEAEAAELAFRTYAGTIDDRAPRVAESLGLISSAFRGLKNVSAEFWDDIVDGVQEADRELAEGARSFVDTLRALQTGAGMPFAVQAALGPRQPVSPPDTIDTQEEKRSEEKKKADKAAEDAFKRITERYLPTQLKLEQEIRDMREAGAKAGKSEAELATQEAAIRKTFADREAKSKRKGPKPEDPNKDAQRELDNLRRQVALVESLEEGERKATEAARIRHEIDAGAYKNASPALKQQLLNEAQLLDTERMRAEAGRQLVDVQLEIARIQGRGEDADLAEARQRLGKFKKDLEAIGKTGEAADVEKLLNLKAATADLAKLQNTYNRVMGEIALETERIQAQVNVGLITESDGQQQLVKLYRDKADIIAGLIPQMRTLAAAFQGTPQGDALVAQIDEIELKTRQLRDSTNLLQQTVRETFQDSFQTLLTDLASASESLGDALRNFLGNLAEGIMNFAAEQLSQRLTGSLMKGLGGLFGDEPAPQEANAATALTTAGTTAAQAIVTAGNTVANAIAAAGGAGGAAGFDTKGAEAVAGDLAGAGDTVNTGAASLGASAVQLASAAGALSPGASAVIQAALQLFTAAQTLMAANAAGAASGAGFSAGGFTGFGGKYQVAGYVHRGEGVLNQGEIRAVGGPRGFYALRNAIATGSLSFQDAGPIYAPAAPRYSFAEGGFARDAAPMPQIAIRPVVAIGTAELAEAMNSADGDRVYLAQARRLKSSLKQLLDIK